MTTATQPHTSQPVTTTPTAAAQTLTAFDRCDRCGARAFLKFAKAWGEYDNAALVRDGDPVAEVLMCAHHGREHGPALIAQGFVAVIDETNRLVTANAAFKGQDGA